MVPRDTLPSIQDSEGTSLCNCVSSLNTRCSIVQSSLVFSSLNQHAGAGRPLELHCFRVMTSSQVDTHFLLHPCHFLLSLAPFPWVFFFHGSWCCGRRRRWKEKQKHFRETVMRASSYPPPPQCFSFTHSLLVFHFNFLVAYNSVILIWGYKWPF